MPSLFRRDPFHPVLLVSPKLTVTDEQNQYIWEILSICSSDSAFAKKAYAALTAVLTSEPAVPPVVTSLTPSSAVIGDPSFTLSVMGTGFTPDSVINFNGGDEVTTFVSDTELTTGINMETATTAGDYPVTVISNGIVSDPVNFSITSPVTLLSPKVYKKEEKLEVKK